jgi:methionyl-tRNA formyltransferase
MKVIFMGTPEFSCPALQKLIDDSEIEIVAVYTKEPKIAGRGHKITNSPIHNLALQNNLKVITPKTLKTPETQAEFINFKADAAVVVAYGLILPKAILEGTKLGCINIHPSLLPRWRGAAPIQRTIIEGDKETGITIIKMDEGIDSGNMITQEKFTLDNRISSQELEDKLADMGADILLKTLKEINHGNYLETKQDSSLVTYAKKLEKEEAQIDWNLEAEKIHNKIRGLNSTVGTFLTYKNERIKILKSEIISLENNEIPGKIISANFTISCKRDAIQPLILQRPGKNPLNLSEFLRGFNFNVEELLK